MAELNFKENSVVPGTPSTNYVKLYAKTDGQLYVKNDAGSESPLVGQKDPESKSIIIENPSATEDLSFFFTDVAITLSKMRPVLTGSATPSVTWTLRHGTDRSLTGAEVVTGGTVTTDTTTGSDITVFDDATIVANSHVWVETTAQSGTVDSIIITVFYDED
jgi:hypothetical protein